MSGTNRRRHNRVRLKQVSTRLKAKDALHLGLAIDNMSMGGCFVRCPTPLKVGAEVALDISRPGAKQVIQVLGRVVSSFSSAPGQTAGMGISFFPMSRETRQRIEGLVAAAEHGQVRAVVDSSRAMTDPETTLPNLPPAPGPPPAMEAASLRSQLAALQIQVKRKDERIADLEAKVEQLKQRLILYGGKL